MEQLVAEKALDEDCKLCPKFTRTFMILGKKWNGLIIEVLLTNGNMRFKDIASSIAKCSDQIVIRNTYEGSSRVDYSLTERGQELRPVMEAVHAWSDKWI